MFCKKCGSEIPDQGKFCAMCGEANSTTPNIGTNKSVSLSVWKAVKWIAGMSGIFIVAIVAVIVWVEISQPKIDVTTENKNEYTLFGNYSHQVVRILSKEPESITIKKVVVNDGYVAARTIVAHTIYSDDPTFPKSEIQRLQQNTGGTTVGELFDAINGNSSMNRSISVNRDDLRGFVDSMLKSEKTLWVDSSEVEYENTSYVDATPDSVDTGSVELNSPRPKIEVKKKYKHLQVSVKVALSAKLNTGEKLTIGKERFCKQSTKSCSIGAEIVHVRVETTNGVREGDIEPLGINVNLR